MSYIGSNKIGKMYLGSTPIGKAYLGSNLVFQSGGVSTAISYIRGGVNAYIDTGITPDNTTRVVVWARNFNPSKSSQWLFGSRVGNQNAAFTLSTVSAASTGSIRVGFGNTNTDSADKFTLLSNYHKYELDGNVFKVDDTVVSTSTSATFSNQYNIFLFGINNGGSGAGSDDPVDICACKIYKSGVLVRNFTPVNSPSVGFYDSVSDTVFTKTGTSNLIYGTFDMTGYTPLQYVETIADSYFDTNVLGTYSCPIIVKFRPSSANTGYKFLLGGRTSTTSGRCDFQIGDNTTANKGYYFDYNTVTNTIYNTASQTGNDLILVKNNNVATLYKNGTQLGTATGSTDTSFSTTYPLFIGALNNAGTGVAGFIGRLYYVGFGISGNYVPMSYNDVAGFYDTYNDVFYTSASSNPFVAGTTL